MTANLTIHNAPFPDGTAGLAVFVGESYVETLQVLPEGYRTLAWPDSIEHLPDALTRILYEAKADGFLGNETVDRAAADLNHVCATYVRPVRIA